MNNTNNALETLVQRDKQIKKTNDKLKASINELDAELETTTNALSNHASNADIHTSKEELIKLIVDHLESLDLGITKEVVSVLPTENISDNTLYFVPNDKGSHNEYLYINDMWELVGSTETNFTDYYTKLETNTLLEGKANSVHNHVVSDITDFPTIPTKLSQLENDMGFSTGGGNTDITISWTNITDKPTIPTKTSELTNDSGYITNVDWNDVTSKPELSQVAISGSYNDLNNTPTIPTKTSQLINDSGFLTSSSGVITSVSWSDITNKPNFSTVATSGSYNDLSNKPTIPKVYNKTLTIQKNGTNVATFTSNSNTDVTADITVPTKVSELSNDSGFITGISWDKVTNKPTLATVATSGSYTDLSNTPAIPTKLSQLENDTGFVNALADVVDTKSNQTINGTKTFTRAPLVSNDATTNGYSIKLNTIARNDVPSQLYHATFRAHDKNDKILGEYCVEKSTTGCTLLNMNVRSEDSNGNQLINALNFSMANDNSSVSFAPSVNNKVNLGTSAYKWANAYIDRVICTRFTHSVNNGSVYITGGSEYDKGATLVLNGEESSGDFIINARDKTRSLYLVGKPDGTLTWGDKNVALDDNLVHRSGDETIAGNKTFSNKIKGNLQGNADTATSANDPNAVHKTGNETINGSKTFTNQMYLGGGGTSYGQISAKDNNSILRLFGGTSPSTGANLDLYGEGLSSGGFSLRARTSDKIVGLDGKTDGTLKWNGKNVALDENLVHRSGNETIGGVKSFNNLMYIYNNMSNKNSQMDLFTTPANTLYSHYMFVDKNNEVSAYMQYGQQNTGTDFIGLFIHDRNRKLHGLQVTTNNEVIPLYNNTYSLGSSFYKWANVYATTLNGAVHSTTANAFMAQKGGYTCTLRNDGNDTYLLMSAKDGTPGTWTDARPLQINNSTGVCSINGHANSATYATTQATSDNSTKIATTAWVRTYVNSVAGSNTVGSSVSAYWSNSSNVTATGQSSSGGNYPACYSEYITKTPVVGTIYSGAQLYTVLNAYASAKASTTGEGGTIKVTTVTAQAIFGSPINPAGKYLCTTANTVKFRAYTASGSASSVGASSVVDNSSTKSIFIRVQ